jgi:hypothetical protein
MSYWPDEHDDDGWDSLPNEWVVVIIFTVLLFAGAFVGACTYVIEGVRNLYRKYIPPLFTLL